jgi:hypothetical protein
VASVPPPEAGAAPRVDPPAAAAPASEPIHKQTDADPAVSPARRKGLFGRFFSRMRGPVPEPSLTPLIRPAPKAPTPERKPIVDVPSDKVMKPEPAPAAAVVPATPAVAEEQTVPQATAEPAVSATSTRATESALKDALDSLGSAHHRPFSRS